VLPLLDAIAANADLLASGNEASFQNKVHLALNPTSKVEPSEERN
jgi:hypothetical protein